MKGGKNPIFRVMGIGIVVLALFAAVAIYPANRRSAHLDREIVRLSQEIEEQKKLTDLYNQVKTAADRMEIPDLEWLALPKPLALTDESFKSLPGRIEEIVRKTGLTVNRVEPEVNSLMGDSAGIRVILSTTGAFSQFRDLLIGLGEGLPSLSKIEHITMDRTGELSQLKMEAALLFLKDKKR